jgi:MFS transporter, putative metabolite:H+ symporter
MSPNPSNIITSFGGIEFHHPGAFWFGAVSTTVGVILHLPMYISARAMGYHLVGMPVDTPMPIGMFLIAIGFISSFYGLYPLSTATAARSGTQISVRALDDAKITKAHVALLVVLAIAVTIDVMKPTTLAYVVPGMAQEYGLRSPLNPTGNVPVALLPLSGISGTVLGSFIWGWLGDRIGRRASMLLAGITFIGTSICGSMPGYLWNLLMCFIMGVGVGGMLPIAYALMAETIPARHRGWLMILIGGDVAGAYVITSWLASELVPEFSWRILWLLGAPTGVLLILLNRWIPESPRFLLANGREAEARTVMDRYGVRIVTTPEPLQIEDSLQSRWIDPFQQRSAKPNDYDNNPWYRGRTGAVRLQPVDSDESTKAGLCRSDGRSNFAGFRADRLSVRLGRGVDVRILEQKKTFVVLTTLTAAAMFGFAVAGDALAGNRLLLYVLLAILIWGINSITAVLSVYSSEIYPTRIRSHGGGLAAGASKAGGVLIIGIVTLGVTAPSISATTLIGAIPMAVSSVGILFFAVETRNRPLEDIALRWQT